MADIGYQFVTVGNAGNANDASTGNTYGGVGYNYAIGKYDVTLNQYAVFLNAVAQTDPLSLYDSNMGTDANIKGILQTGVSGSFSYSVIGSGLRPVTEVSWFDAARFCNWMTNGQPTGLGEVAGSTETGAYTLNGALSGIFNYNGTGLYRLPTENEWYKAAYYDPGLNGGAGGYWSYATRSNTAPGNVVGAAVNQANYKTTVYSVTQTGSVSGVNALTDVGAFTNSASAYGTYDENGDVYQWNDAVILSSLKGARGGPWSLGSGLMQSSFQGRSAPEVGLNDIGFRVATIATVPEPSSAVSLIVAGGLLLARRRR